MKALRCVVYAARVVEAIVPVAFVAAIMACVFDGLGIPQWWVLPGLVVAYGLPFAFSWLAAQGEARD